MAQTSSILPVSGAVLQHPVYAIWAPVWRKLAHIYDGSGGFLDGAYLVAHPREWKDWNSESPRLPTKKLIARRRLARYENLAGVILDQKRAALFREGVTRSIGSKTGEEQHPLEAWWENVDGYGCTIDDWMSESFVWSGLFGHVFHYMDRMAAVGDVTTQADAGALIIRGYLPLDVPDWLQSERGELTAVKLLEAPERPSIDDAASLNDGQFLERVVNEETWELRRVEKKGRSKPQVTTTDGPFPHQFGALPIVVQYGLRKALAPLIGQSILGDPNLYIDVYNLTSEIREILRAQTFGMLNVPLGTTADRVSAEEAKTMLGDEKGVENVLFSPGPAAYVQPDTDNVTVYQEERTQLMRTIYRMVGLPWESDSKDAEAEGSLQRKREDLNQRLSLYASNCQKAEEAIAKLWFRGTYGDTWEREWDVAEVTISYPSNFDTQPFTEAAEMAAAAQTLGYGPKMLAEINKQLIPAFLPDATPQLVNEIEAECDSQAVANAEMDAKQKQAEIDATAAKASGGFGA